MKKTGFEFRIAACAALTAVGAVIGGSSSFASTIVAAKTAVASSTFISQKGNDYSILNTINQNGLSETYESGVTDFDTYVGTNPTHTSKANGNEWFSQDYGDGGISGLSVTFGFGDAAITLDRMALWNEEFSGLGRTSLLTSMDGIEFTALTVITPLDSAFAQRGTDVPYVAQVFSFVATELKYLKMVLTGCPGPPSGESSYVGCGIGEVAFSAVAAVSPVPVPAALPLLATGLGALAWFKRRKGRSRTAAK